MHKIGRRTSALAAGAVSATLGISTAMAATPNLRQAAFRHEVASATRLIDHFSSFAGGTLRGFVFDPNGAVVTGASVTVTNAETNEQRYTITGGDGQYTFSELNPGNYHLKIQSTGFDVSEVPFIAVRAGDDNRLDQTLSIAPVTAEVTISDGSERVMMAGGAIVAMPSDPLVKAAMEDDLDALTTALITRPDINVRDKETGATAFEYAVRNGNRDMIQTLLSAKVDVNARDREGQTALMMLSDKVTSEIVWDLINAGAKVNLRDKDGDTALISIAEVNNVDALKALLDAGAKVNVSNDDGQTALMIAAINGHVNNVRALILAGADVNARDKEGKSALMHANSNNEAAVARLLKAHGAIEFEVQEKQ
ncbi:MAG TPA: ankyrin repeat domain-containing protein [Pyrinomonadaceae bacterium]